MLDPRSLSDCKSEILESCRRRGLEADVDAAIEHHSRVAALQTELNEANHRRNDHQASGKVELSPEERAVHASEGRNLKTHIANIESELAGAQTALQSELERLPNLIHPDVPEGGEANAREIRRVGDPPRFDFKPRDHLEIGDHLDLFDFEAGSRVAGQKFYYLKNGAVLLEVGLQRYALDVLIKAGFTPYSTPDLARPRIVSSLGFNPRGEETQIYSLSNADLCLIGTAEITLGGIYANTILQETDLPLRMAGLSHCFRTEAGGAGREGKGLYRVHQFTKVEMFVITRPEDSESMHQELLAIEERIFQDLELSYRVVDIAAGDLGAPAHRKFDLEAWMPGRGKTGAYGEVTSASNCTDFQARDLQVRFRRKGSKKSEHVHMLNGTAISNARAILAILENHQQADGTVAIPRALHKYVGCESLEPII